MWQNIIVIAIIAVTAALVGWSFFRKLTGKSSGCGGCSAAGSCCGSSASGNAGGPPAATTLRPLKDCGCGH